MAKIAQGRWYWHGVSIWIDLSSDHERYCYERIKQSEIIIFQFTEGTRPVGNSWTFSKGKRKVINDESCIERTGC